MPIFQLVPIGANMPTGDCEPTNCEESTELPAPQARLLCHHYYHHHRRHHLDQPDAHHDHHQARSLQPKADAFVQPPDDGALMASYSVFVVEPGRIFVFVVVARLQ